VTKNLETEKLTEKIRTLGLSSGAELVGIASAEQLEGAPMGHRPSDILPDARSVVVLACGRKLNEDRHYFYWWHHGIAIKIVALKLTIKWRRKRAVQCVNKVASFLKNAGFKAVVEWCGWADKLSFKRVLYYAGLGVFGKGGFIIHPKHGPLNVLGCIVTDAPLKYGTPLNLDLCGECIECMKACKYGALKKQGKSFTWIGRKCRVYDKIMNPVTERWTYGPCNSKCINVCPIGIDRT